MSRKPDAPETPFRRPGEVDNCDHCGQVRPIAVVLSDGKGFVGHGDAVCRACLASMVKAPPQRAEA